MGRLLPKPSRQTAGTGVLDLVQGLVITTLDDANADTRALARRFQNRFASRLGRSPSAGAACLQLQVTVVENSVWPALDDDERYRLLITPAGATLTARTRKGAHHGLERCLQWLDVGAGGPQLRATEIEDGPRLPWRGLMLDLARHFLDLPTLLRTLDGMAACGLNVLHLHLNDDQGFALECPRQPRLHQMAGHDGYLRTGEVDMLVRAAAERGIRVVPELDVPGHAGALLLARPELAADAAPEALPRAFGQTRYALDPSLPATWAFVDDVLADLVERFPDQYLHIGGDEVHPAVFAFSDARRHAWAQERGLADAAAVQAWFMAELSARVRALGRVPLAWDEVLHPSMPDDLAVQSWRGAASLERALRAGQDALFSAGYYLDLAYPAEWHYAFAPDTGERALQQAEAELRARAPLADVAVGLGNLQSAAAAESERLPAAAARGRVLGGEACLWGELVTSELLDRRLYSRLAAVAERCWSPHETCDANDFSRRLPQWLAHLEAVTACRPQTLAPVWPLRWGVAPEEAPDLELLLDALAPVPWYRRLLGDAVLAARLQGAALPPAEQVRPYDADSRLTRPVDLLVPDSPAARVLDQGLADAGGDASRVARAAARGRLLALARHWQALPVTLLPLCERPGPVRALAPRIRQLGELGQLLPRLLEGWPSKPAGEADWAHFQALLEAAAPAVAETRLAVLDPLQRWHEAMESQP